MKQTLPQQQNFRIQRWVAVVSIVLLVLKFIAYYYTRSVAVLTDATESIVNVIAGLIGLYSLYVAARPRDLNHPYGHGKAEFLSAAIEGVLIGIAGLFILYEALHKFFFPEPVRKTDLGIFMIGTTALINYALGTICVRQGRKNNSLALEASGKHLQTDTYSTVAVILGLVLLHWTQWIWVDAVVALLLCAFLLYTSYHIVRKSVAGIMDEADTSLLTGMVDLMNHNRSSNWVDLHNLRVIKYGSILHIDAHLTVPWYFTVKQAHQEVDGLSELIRKSYGHSLELFIHSDGCIEGLQCPICTKKQCPVRRYPLAKKITWTLENVLKNKRHNTQTTTLIL